LAALVAVGQLRAEDPVSGVFGLGHQKRFERRQLGPDRIARRLEPDGGFGGSTAALSSMMRVVDSTTFTAAILKYSDISILRTEGLASPRRSDVLAVEDGSSVIFPQQLTPKRAAATLRQRSPAGTAGTARGPATPVCSNGLNWITSRFGCRRRDA
jgi:hypothetical protein